MIRSWFEWADALPSSIAIRESVYGWPYLLTAHAVSMVLFAGLTAMMDLRLLGVAFRQTPLSQVQRQLLRQDFFWTKLALMLLAGLNALLFDRITSRNLAAWDLSPRPPRGARLAGAVSLTLWAGVIVLGRFTAYNWLD